MECPRCRNSFRKRITMKQVKRKGGFHKQTKFVCPDCGMIKMKKNS